EPFAIADDGGVQRLHLGRKPLLLLGRGLALLLRHLAQGLELQPSQRRQVQLALADLRAKRLVALGLLGLALEAFQAAALLAEDVVEAVQILLRLLYLALGRLAPGLVLGDARRLLDEVAAVLWLGRDDQADPPLLDDRVGLGAHPRAEEELDDVEQAARRLV